MQLIAMENNLAETAFVNLNTYPYELRWFTPTTEVDLCGHATLATSRVLFDEYLAKDENEILFSSRSGILKSFKHHDKIILDCEKAARREARRGLVASHDLAKGQILQKKDIEIKRPAHGLEPKDIDWVIGRVLKCNIQSDNFIQKEDLV